MGFMIVLTTTDSREEAERISQALLEERLVACVNIIDNVYSLFWWQNKIDKTQEFLLLMKTHEKLFAKLEEKLRSLHSYQVPEIVGLPITTLSEPYMKWLKENLQKAE